MRAKRCCAIHCLTGSDRRGTSSRRSRSINMNRAEPTAWSLSKRSSRRVRSTCSVPCSMDWDVAVIGAGAAGFAAALELQRHELRVVLIEARDRVGGRAWSFDPPGAPRPAELGVEFIHGRPAATLALLREARIAEVTVSGERWEYRNGRLTRRLEELWAGTDLIERARTLEEDESVEAFLQRFAGEPQHARAIEAIRTLVAGFDAADPARASVRAIAEEWAGDASLGAGASRPVGGYGALFRALEARLDPEKVHLMLQTIVDEVAWRRGRVRVRATRFGRPLELTARAAIETIAMGTVVKVVLLFDAPFWETLGDERYREAGFFHVPQGDFPVIWTTAPAHDPVLAAWAGGPAADRLAQLEHDAIVRAALDQVGMLFDPVAAEKMLRGAYLHDWIRDPFARGAYSYLTVGARPLRKVLSLPVEGTIFFAGEAQGVRGESGTVGGALESGTRAARSVARILTSLQPRSVRTTEVL